MCSAMQHREAKKSICHPGARKPLSPVMDCAMDCCKPATHSLIVSAIFVLPESASLAVPLKSEFSAPRPSIEFSDAAQAPEIPPPRIRSI